MTDLRQQAHEAVEEMPEKNLAALLPLLKILKGNEIDPLLKLFQGEEDKPKKFVYNEEISQKLMGSAGEIFGTTEDIDNYIKEQRDWERKF